MFAAGIGEFISKGIRAKEGKNQNRILLFYYLLLLFPPAMH